LEDNAISDWAEVLRLAGLPQLRRLHLSGNPISSIAYPAHSILLSALLTQQLPTAAYLDQQQQQPAEQQQRQQEQQQPFALLQALLLGNCQISSWADVDALNRLPRLAELRLSGNPLFAAEAGASGGGRRYEVRTCSCSATPQQQGRGIIWSACCIAPLAAALSRCANVARTYGSVCGSKSGNLRFSSTAC
jgi:hypothetical protein